MGRRWPTEELPLVTVSSWPGPGFLLDHSTLALAGKAIAPKASFPAPPRTHSGDQFLPFCRSKRVTARCQKPKFSSRVEGRHRSGCSHWLLRAELTAPVNQQSLTHPIVGHAYVRSQVSCRRLLPPKLLAGTGKHKLLLPSCLGKADPAPQTTVLAN